VISSQVIEGGVDSVLFENFIYHTLRAIRLDPELCDRQVILFMDNAVIHRHSIVFDAIKSMKVNVLFNA
jgi:hypothetical protein